MVNGYSYWYGDRLGGLTGLNCANMETFKCLEKLENLEYLYTNQWQAPIGNDSEVIDLRRTNLKSAYVNRNNSKCLLSI